MTRLLLVEDDADLSAFVKEGLEHEGFSIDIARDGQSALDLVEQVTFDAVLLDVMMPGALNGYAVLKKLRSRGKTLAILLVTSKGQERDKLEGLNSGADDYIVKPFLLSELTARVRAVLRRTAPSDAPPSGILYKMGPLQMDLLKHEVKKGGKILSLTKTEFDLLECLMRRPGQVLSQQVLIQSLGNEFASPNLIGVHIKNLRSKIDGKSSESLIETIRGVGYKLNV